MGGKWIVLRVCTFEIPMLIYRRSIPCRDSGTRQGSWEWNYARLHSIAKFASLVEEQSRLRKHPERPTVWMPCGILERTKWNSQSRRNSEAWIVVLLLDKQCGPEVGFGLFIRLFIFNLCTSPAWVVCKS